MKVQAWCALPRRQSKKVQRYKKVQTGFLYPVPKEGTKGTKPYRVVPLYLLYLDCFPMIHFWSKREITMNTKPLFTPTADGAAYDIQPAGVLMLLADTVYGDSCESSPAGRARAKAMIDAMLKAARAGGFTQSDILETLLSRGDVSHRVKALAVEACAAAGNDAIGEIFNAMRSR